MSFVILPGLAVAVAWAAVALLALVLAVLSVPAVVQISRHRGIRLARHQSIPRYYRAALHH